MIYHICPPDTKFIHPLLDRFELVKPDFNRRIIIESRYHADHKTDLKTSRVEYYGPINKEIIKRIKTSGCHGVVVHTLNDDILELSLGLLGNFPVFWRSWGPDLHDIIYPDNDLILPYTEKLINDWNMFNWSSLKFLRILYHRISGKDKDRKARTVKKQEFLRSVNFIATTTRAEFRMLNEKVQGIKAEYMPLNYRSLDLKFLPELIDMNNNNDSVMLGHSSYYHQNHADILYKLRSESYEGSIVVPLNYGNSNYRDKIIRLGKKLYNGRIDFLTDFLKFEDYQKLINKFHAFILNSKVQSGGGNIMYFLFQGSKVYLREENPVYQDYKEIGIKLYSIQKELNRSHLVNEYISLEDQRNNRKKLKKFFNSKVKKRK